MTRAPCSLAICTAATPTPEPAAITSTSSPGRDRRLARQHLPRGQERRRQRRRVGERQRLRLGDDVLRRHHHLLAVAARDVLAHEPEPAAQVVAPREALAAAPARVPGVDDDLVADGDAAHAGPHLVDGAGDVGAEAERVLELQVRQPVAHPDVEVVHGHGGDAHAHLAGSGVRLGQLLDGEDLGAPVFSQRRLRAFTRLRRFRRWVRRS